jgi:hypothetical protein
MSRGQPNYLLQATPGCALLFLVAHWSGAPEHNRWTREMI